MDFPNAEIWFWTQVMLVLSVCVVLISVVNYLLQNDRKQEIKTIFIGLGMAVWSLGLHIYARFERFDFESADIAIWLCAVIPILGGVTGLTVLKLLRFLIYKTTFLD